MAEETKKRTRTVRPQPVLEGHSFSSMDTEWTRKTVEVHEDPTEEGEEPLLLGRLVCTPNDGWRVDETLRAIVGRVPSCTSLRDFKERFVAAFERRSEVAEQRETRIAELVAAGLTQELAEKAYGIATQLQDE